MSALPVSVVIVCKNAAATISQVVAAAARLTTDVVVVDTGSTDGTLALLQGTGVRVFQQEWLGYGPTKNWGNGRAAYDWILSLDADEVMDDELVAAIQGLSFEDEKRVYRLKRLNYLKEQPIRHGEWGRDSALRLFNRRCVQWNDAPVHEGLVLPPGATTKQLPGRLHHYTTTDIVSYQQKLQSYAHLMARKYFAAQKKGSMAKAYASSFFSFAKFYFFYGGLLDKAAGWQIAMAHARYTFRKYQTLVALQREKDGAHEKL